MKILNKIAIKNLKLNKKRTISMIIGIILSVSLISAVSTLFTSFQETLVQYAINKSGYYHLKIEDVLTEDINKLKDNKNIKEIYEVNQIGYAELKESKNEYKPYLKVISMNKETYEKLKFKLISGRSAENSDELVISNHIMKNAGVNYKIGDKIKINIGKRMTNDGYKLYSNNLYNKENEKLEDMEEKEFTIVGIMERPNYNFEDYSDSGYTVITNNMDSEEKSIFISLKNPREYKNAISEILGASQYNKISEELDKLKYQRFNINLDLLRWEIFAFTDSTISMLVVVCGIVIAIIMITSIFCIRNSFAISTTEKIKMYGMLSSIGATKKQIKKNVIFEAMILGLIGIPLGILGGLFAVFVLIKIVNALIGNYLFNNINGIVLKISLFPIIVSVVLGLITIYLSAIASARRASKVSPIEQLRNSEEIKMKNKNLKVPKIISKVFKIGGTLAYKNLKRSKKKYRTTVISLTVSIFVFITMNSFITNVFSFAGNYYEDYDYNITISADFKELNQDEINQLLSLNNDDEKFILYSQNDYYIKIKDMSKVNEEDEVFEDMYYDEEQEKYISTGEGKVCELQIVALDEASFKKYVKKIGENYEKVKSTGILCDDYFHYDESGNSKNIRRYKYEKNDIITGKYGEKDINIKIGAITKTRPYGLEQNYYQDGYLVVNQNEYKDLNLTIRKICINSSNAEQLQEQLEKLGLDIRISNLEKQVKEQKSMILVINIFLYGFIAVITLIGVTNIFNTITSNMELRQKEFAMLKSIGMTKKEFNKMINLETIFYSTKSLLYGIALGLLGTIVLYKAFTVKMDTGIYIPVNPIIISILFVFILVFIIMKYSVNKINKQNTIETIRNENI